MCGRYLRRSDKQRIAETFHIAKGLADLVLPPWDYNVAPTTFQPVIRADRDGEREITLMRWGLIPNFARDLKTFALSTINARAESIATSAIYRGPFERRRCLVPADGFYEWKETDTPTLFGLDPTAKPSKSDANQPYAFTLTNGGPFAFAGLWDRWKDPAGGALESFTIITTTPNELTATVHDRMPVILAPQDYDLWLAANIATDRTPQLELLSILRPYPADRMTARQAHPDVGNVCNNHSGLLNSA